MSFNYIDAKEWVKTWKKAGAELEKIRRKELKEMNTVQALENLLPAFNDALQRMPLRETSGLVEQQRYFKRWRGK